MSKHSILTVGFLVTCGLWMSGCASDGATMSRSGSGSESGSSAGGEGKAAAVQTDPLQSCLAGIPSTASAGNRQLAEEGCRRNEAARLGIVGTRNDREASGTQGDSLEACLARIPKDATAGQRMLAEQSCRRDHPAQR